MAKTTYYIYNFQPINKSQVYPYDDATIKIILGSEDTFIIGGLTDNSNAISAWWRSKRLDFSDQHEGIENYFKTVDRVQLEYVDRYEDTPVTIALSDDGGENWVYRTRVLGTGDGRQKVADFYFHDKGRITSKDFTVQISSSSSTTAFTWTGFYIFFEPRGPFQEI